MENEKLNIKQYEQNGLGNLYYGLISFIGRYVEQNYNPTEIFKGGYSYYAMAVIEMKKSLKELLNYLLAANEVFLPSLNRNVKLKNLNTKEQIALEDRCKEYILLNLNKTMEQYAEKLNCNNNGKSRK